MTLSKNVGNKMPACGGFWFSHSPKPAYWRRDELRDDDVRLMEKA
jgi:hypothetical protein